MLNDIARVFSSQGVLIPGSEKVPVSDRQAQAKPACDHKGPDCRCFGPKFDQASAKLELSRRGRELQAAAGGDGPAEGAGGGEADAAGAADATQAGATDAAKTDAGKAAGKPAGEAQAGARGADGKPLSEDEQKQVRELEKRDRQVKAHEAAHQASAGGQARGGANYDYQTGPDGKQYAVGGHVDIDVSPVDGNPRATLAKAQTAQRAALAPADPSGQDRAVAAAAAQMALQAQKDMAQRDGGEDSRGEGPQGGGSEGPRIDGAGAGSRGDARVGAYRRAPAKGAAVSVYA